MGTVLSALVVLAALTASGVLLVQLFVSESRRARGAGDPARIPSPPVPAAPAPPRPAVPAVAAPAVAAPAVVVPAAYPPLPERAVPPPPAPRARPEPYQRYQPYPPVPPAPVYSADGAWLWTGSAWVPAWWGGPTVPPPPPYAAATYVPIAPPRPQRSRGCLASLGTGCATVLAIAAVIVLLLVAASGGLTSLNR